MNIRTSAFRRLAILSLSALAFGACDNKETAVVVTPDPIVTLTPSGATLNVGQTVTFSANVQNDGTGATSGVTYTSSNTAVATVNSTTGVVTAVAPGTTTIIATSKLNNTKTASAQVIVNPVVVVPVTIAVVPSSASLNAGGTLQLVPQVSGTANTAVTYTTSDNTVATVSSTGLVTALQKNGTAVITVTSAADPTKTATSVITVTGGVNVGTVAITMTPTAASVDVGGTVTLVATVTGSTNTAKTFTTSDATIATVNSTTGVVTATNKPGTVIITATATADPTKTATSVITVNRPPVTVTASPSAVTISPGQTTTITPVVTGSAADIAAGVTCTIATAEQSIATVTSPGCVVTGIAAGTATVLVKSVGDPTKSASVTVTVQALTQPSISIASVVSPANPGNVPGGNTNVAPNSTVSGTIDVTVNVSAGTASSIQRVAVRLGGVEACTQTFTPPLAPTQGVATITCPLNTAQVNSLGAAVFANGTYSLTADAFSTSSSVSPVATAVYGNITLNNTNAVRGVVTYDNTLSNTDNTPASTPQIDAAGNVWNGGAATVTLTPAIFTGTAVANIDVTVDLNCNGVIDGGEPTKTAAISGGTGSVTFSEASGVAATIDAVEDGPATGGVCYIVGNGRAANTTVVTLPAGGGTGNVTTVGTAAGTVAATAQNVDNVQPVIAGGAALPAAVTANNNYAGSTTTFSTATTGGTAVDGGVGGVTFSFFGVSSSVAAGTQAEMRAAVTGQTAITSASQLASSTISNSAYTLIERATDALGNTTYKNLGTFGVDLENPTIAIAAGSMATTGTINGIGAANDIIVAVTDTFSGPISLKVRGTISSVLELDTDAGTEVKCLADPTTGATAAVPLSGICPLLTLTPLVNVAGQTEQGTIVLPDASAPSTDEGYWVIDVQGADRAGNISAATLTFTTLNDVTAPGAVITNLNFNFLSGVTTLTGQIRENVDLAQYDTRFTYPGLAGVPDDVPFLTPTAVDTYGLPLTGVVDVNAASSTTVRDIKDGTGAVIAATQFGFGATDVAGNYSFTGTALTGNTAGPGVTGLFGGAFPTDFDASFVARSDASGAVNASTIDRSGTPTFPVSRSIFAQVRTTATGANPVATVYFYYVNPGTNGVFGDGDDFNVLVSQASAASATVVTGISDRTFTFTGSISTTQIPRINASAVYPVFAIGVAANGSAIMSDILSLTVQD